VVSKPSAIDDLLDIFDGSNFSNAQILLPQTPHQHQKTAPPKSSDSDSLNSFNSFNSSIKNSETELIHQTTKAEEKKKIQVNEEIKSISDSVTYTPSTTTAMVTNTTNFLNNPSKLDNFLNEVQKLEKHINSLSNKTLSSLTILEKEWKELNDHQDKHSANMTISVARCYPNKNRFQDLLPYDQTRIIIQNKNDDYINATYIGKLTSSESVDTNNFLQRNQPNFIVAQVKIFFRVTNLLYK